MGLSCCVNSMWLFPNKVLGKFITSKAVGFWFHLLFQHLSLRLVYIIVFETVPQRC